MSLRILFFASIRERVGKRQCNVDYSGDTTATVVALIESLGLELGEGGGAALRAANTICAVNRCVVPRETRLTDGDEVAFFPPVTGG